MGSLVSAATAETNLNNWLAAEAAVQAGQSFSIGNRSLTRAELEEIRNQITFWKRVYEAATADSAGSTRPGVRVATWE